MVEDYLNHRHGDCWKDNVRAVKALLPKVAKLSQLEFEAIREIRDLVRNISSDDALFTMFRKLNSLEG